MSTIHGSVATLATTQHGAVHISQLVELGVSRRRVQRCNTFIRCRRGVYAVGHVPDTPEFRWSAAVLAAGPGSVLSHLAAARLWAMLPWAPSRIDISAPAARHPMHGVHRHVTGLDSDEVAVCRGIAVTSPARTIADCAQLLQVDQLVRVMREARHLGIFDAAALERYCDPHPRRHGAPCLREALQRHGARRAGYRSSLEQRVRRVVMLRGAPEPIINAPWHTDIGDVEVDLAWPELMVCVEADGPTHDDAEQQKIDRRNRAALARAGWRVFVVHWRDFEESPTLATTAAIATITDATRATFAPLSVANLEIVEGERSPVMNALR